MIVTIILRGGAVLRTHSMVVEDFTVVEVGMVGDIRLINKRKGECMWVMELWRW